MSKYAYHHEGKTHYFTTYENRYINHVAEEFDVVYLNRDTTNENVVLDLTTMQIYFTEKKKWGKLFWATTEIERDYAYNRIRR